MRVIVTTRQGARFTERVACETDDPDLARIVAFVHGTAALHAAGELPEAPDGIPERRPSGRAWRASAGVPVESRGPRSTPAPKRPRKAPKRKRSTPTTKRAAAKKSPR